MDWYKKESGRYRDSEIRTTLGRKNFCIGHHLLNVCEEIVADTFSIGKWIESIKKGLLDGKPITPPFVRTIDLEMLNMFLYMENEEEINRCYEVLPILQDMGYMEFTLENKVITLSFPKILQSLSEFQRDELTKALKDGSLPYEEVRKHLSKEQAKHYDKTLKGSKPRKENKKQNKDLKKPKKENDLDLNSDTDTNTNKVLVNDKLKLYSLLDKNTGEESYFIKDRKITRDEFESLVDM